MGKRNHRARQRDQRRQTKEARAQRRAEAARAQGHARAEGAKARRRAETAAALRQAAERVGSQELGCQKLGCQELPDGPITGLTARFTDAGFDITSTPIAEEDQEAWRTYLDAHMLLPGDYHLGGPMAEAVAEEAFDVLGKKQATEIAWLRSIVVLGHTPTATALEALNHHATSGQPLADVARMAADECAEWISHEASAGAAADMVN